MPNGGSDCCGTCCFNSTHEGKTGHFDTALDAQVRCVIRDLLIENPFWTYCVNHPGHNMEKIQTPIGPVYEDAGGYPYHRKVCVESPDSEEIRVLLLRLLEDMPERPQVEYPTHPTLDEAVIDQLMRFRERRAVPGLRRVCRFDPFAKPEGDNPFGRKRITTVALALEALASVEGDGALPDLARGLSSGLQQATEMASYEPKKDPQAAIRYHCVCGLQYCSREAAREFLRKAADDPNEDVAAIAKQSLDKHTQGA